MSAKEEVFDDLPEEDEEEEEEEEGGEGEEENENDYYASDVEADDGTGARDATFQIDPEYYEFACLSTEEAWNFLDSQARDVGEKLKLDVPSSRILLDSVSWNVADALKRYREDKDVLLIEAHLRPNCIIAKKATSLSFCPVCLKTSTDTKLYGLPCGHMFCINCWSQYLVTAVQGGKAAAIECMQCSLYVSLEMVQQMIQSQVDIYARFLRTALAEFVKSHYLLRWCPGPNCTTVFQVVKRSAKQVTCSHCAASCCFMCGEPYHCPTNCETLHMWLKKLQDDSETANYILTNTKECPKCHVVIEKNGGCNHMHCSQCNYDFCWMCLADWKNHTDYYNCSKYKENPAAATARERLKKYMFYYERWATHDQSLMLEQETGKKIMTRVEEKVSMGSGTWIDWQCVIDAMKLLRKCRYTLKYTYPYAYYMDDSNRKALFEYQQAQLEHEIENLSWKVERLETTSIADLMQQMTVSEVKRLTLLRDFVPT